MKIVLFIVLIFSTLTAIEYEKSANIVSDKKHKLMWQDDEEVLEYLETYISAEVYCDNLILNGYIDWRVPSLNEMIYILDVSEKRAINKKFQYVKSDFYGTKSSFVEDDFYLWGIDFKTGIIKQGEKTKESYTRCVRDIL